MKYKNLFLFVLSLLSASQNSYGREIFVSRGYGEEMILECSDNEGVDELQNEIESQFNIPIESQEWLVDGRKVIALGKIRSLFGRIQVLNTTVSRHVAKNYFLTPTKDDEKNITYMIKTLADKSLPALAFCRGSLQDAGDAVAHLHPLKFFEVVFCDEELKVGIRNMKKRKQIWPEFSSGMADSFKNEASVGNMKQEYLEEFAARVGLDLSKVMPYVQSGKWNDFLNGLVTHIPRIGDHDKYDM
jgi:hypothetical protein